MFTRKEQKYLIHPYFRIIREEQQYVELQSVNTGHCWNIFENQFEQTNKIKLYHKHKEANTYYHQHRLCRIVAEAISNIKEHNDYVLQLKEKKRVGNKELLKAVRRLKVCESSGRNYKPTPAITLKRDWLKSWGFDLGKKANVVYEDNGKLIITKQ